MNWKAEAERLYGLYGHEWSKIASEMMQYFPGERHFEVKERIRGYIRKLPQYKQQRQENIQKSSVEYKSDGSITSEKFITVRDGEDMTPEFIIKAHGLKPSVWEVVSYKNNFWNSQIKGGIKQISYQSKLTVKPKKYELDLNAIDKHFDELDRKHKPVAILTQRKSGDMFASVEIADLHFGRLCWHGDTGQNYDHKIAREIYLQIISDICGQLKHYDIEKILFPIGNDLVNSDTPEKTTTAGTPQDTDVRWQKITNTIIDTVIDGVDMLKRIAFVDAFYVDSNHDKVTTYSVVNTVRAWFRSDDGISVDRDAISRKYRLCGNVMLGFCHGNKEKSPTGTQTRLGTLAALMPVEAPKMWAESTCREFHAAHLHTEQAIEEKNGVVVRRISSPTAPDTWTFESGWVGNVRKAQTFIYDKSRGHVMTINTPI